jgi:hypothetical protein
VHAAAPRTALPGLLLLLLLHVGKLAPVLLVTPPLLLLLLLLLCLLSLLLTHIAAGAMLLSVWILIWVAARYQHVQGAATNNSNIIVTAEQRKQLV